MLSVQKAIQVPAREEMVPGLRSCSLPRVPDGRDLVEERNRERCAGAFYARAVLSVLHVPPASAVDRSL